jgi:Tol biopolymer transport system component
VRRGAWLVAGLAVMAVGPLYSGCTGSSENREDIVFVSTRDDDYAVYGMGADGEGEHRLTDERGDPSSADGLYFQVDPALAPTGTRIAFSSRREGSFDLYVMNADGSETQRLTASKQDDARPSWAPDGSRITFGRDRSIYVMEADGTGARRITRDNAEESQPSWSPDGDWIAYVRRTPGTTARELWLVRPDGSERHALTSLSSASFSPSWSPDSKRIAFSAAINSTTYDLYTIAVDGKRMKRLTGSTDDSFEPAWSPDAKTIAFSRGGSIVTIDLEGNEVELTDAENNDSSPAWNPRPPAEED